MPYRTPLRAARVSLAAALAAATLLPARAARAQSMNGARLGVAAGVATVERSGTGVYASGLIDYPLAARYRLVRMEGSLSYWPVEADRVWSNHVWSFGGALVQGIGSGRVQPYGLLGAAMYISDEREPLAGINGGAGVRFRAGGSVMIAEARVHRRLAAVGGRVYVPLTVGVIF
jgi:hypothetical protein